MVLKSLKCVNVYLYKKSNIQQNNNSKKKYLIALPIANGE